MAENATFSSSGAVSNSQLQKGQYTNLGAKIVNLNGYDTLQFNMESESTVITNQETMSYMDGGLTTEASIGTGGIFSMFTRGLTGSSVLQNTVTNPTSKTLKMVLSPLLQGSIVQVDLLPGETWRFADKTFMACTPNLAVSGNINIFSNFQMMFAGQNLTYTTITADKGTGGTVWVSAHGGVEKHEIEMGSPNSTPLFINNGCFLGMIDSNQSVNFWRDYVSVGTANSLLSAMFTQLGFVIKIQDTYPPLRQVKCIVLTQSLNQQNMEKYIANIVSASMPRLQSSQGQSFLSAGVGPFAQAPTMAQPQITERLFQQQPFDYQSMQTTGDSFLPRATFNSYLQQQGGHLSRRKTSNKKGTKKSRKP